MLHRPLPSHLEPPRKRNHSHSSILLVPRLVDDVTEDSDEHVEHHHVAQEDEDEEKPHQPAGNAAHLVESHLADRSSGMFIEFQDLNDRSMSFYVFFIDGFPSVLPCSRISKAVRTTFMHPMRVFKDLKVLRPRTEGLSRKVPLRSSTHMVAGLGS